MLEQSTPSHSTTDSQRRRSPSFLRRLGNFDLFSNLIFNREKVYRGLKRLSPVGTSASKEEAVRSRSVESEGDIIPSIEDKEVEDMPGDSMISYLETTNIAMSKPRGRLPKKRTAAEKPKRRLGVTAAKKRSPPVRIQPERASKIQKTVPKANSGKRVNGGATINDAYVLSDSEDENVDSQRQIAIDSLTPPRQTLKIDSPGSEDDLRPIPTPILTSSHTNNLQSELVRMKAAHAKEIECLQQQLHASGAKVKQIKEDAERQALDLQRRQSITSDKQTADREAELELERRRTSDLTWECDHLRKEMEAARSCLKGELDLIQRRDEYERLYKEEQDTNAELVRGLEEKEREATRKAESMAAEIQELARQIEDLRRKYTDLMNENATLRTTVPSSQYTEDSLKSSSPAPSLSSLQSASLSDNDVKLANVRKTYITVKKRYDNLHSVASNISTATRPWDYSNFGEFGAYLRQLKTALDENGAAEQGSVLVLHGAKNE
jgi:regulator of replication initiation timing